MTDDTTVEHRPTVTGVLQGGEHLCLVFYDRRGTKIVRVHKDERIVLGRAHPSDVVIEDPSLSRQHASFVWSEDGVFVEDLESTNGVHVAGERVTRVRLDAGVAVTLGAVTASLHRTGPRGAQMEGIEAHDRFLQRAEEEVQRARRFGRGVSIVFVRALEREAHVDTFVPHLVGELRDIDRLSVYSSNSVLLLFPELAAADALSLARRLVRSRAGSPTLRAGLAVFPADGSNAEALLVSARNAARRTSAEEPVHYRAEAAIDEAPLILADAMVQVYSTLDRVAPSHLSVLIVGETGSGKELVARAVHEKGGPRASGPLCSVNCGALTDTLLQSALFGHVRGAFTGADSDHEGLFEKASGGTLFLDEIGELSAPAQAALLRVLETGKVVRVGSTDEISVDVRIVAATHRDLHERAAEGTFRQDLLFRLDGITIEVPPLRERREEIVPLAERFLAQASLDRGKKMELSEGACARLRAHAWPGNVRELRNAVERAAIISEGERIEEADLPHTLRDQGGSAHAQAPSIDDGRTFKEQIKEYETGLILKALEASNGNQTDAAKRLGMPLRTLVHKIRSYGIKKRFGTE